MVKFSYDFKQMESSEFLIKASEQKIEHAARYLLKNATGRVVFGKKGHLYSIEVKINAGGEGFFKAQASNQNLYAAIDSIIDKLEKQFVKKKDKIQTHKNRLFSKRGKLRRVNAQFEHLPLGRGLKKAA